MVAMTATCVRVKVLYNHYVAPAYSTLSMAINSIHVHLIKRLKSLRSITDLQIKLYIKIAIEKSVAKDSGKARTIVCYYGNFIASQ